MCLWGDIIYILRYLVFYPVQTSVFFLTIMANSLQIKYIINYNNAIKDINVSI